jgi:hypothetical protein
MGAVLGALEQLDRSLAKRTHLLLGRASMQPTHTD